MSYDAAIQALLENHPERAIALIQERMKEHRDACSDDFELEQDTFLDISRTTDFLPFHGWEAA